PIDPGNYLAAGPGPAARDVNSENTNGVRAALEFKAADSLTITPSIFLQKTRLGAPFTFDSPPGTFDRPMQTRDVQEPSADKLQLYSLNVRGDVAGVHLTSSTSYRIRTFTALEDESKVTDYFFDPDVQSSVYPVGFRNEFVNHDFTQEIRGSF